MAIQRPRTHLVKLDSRGRVTIANLVKRNGIEPAELWRLSFGPNQSIILNPVTIVDPDDEPE